MLPGLVVGVGANWLLTVKTERSLGRMEFWRGTSRARQNMHNFLAKRFPFPRRGEVIPVVVSIVEKMERELET